MSYVRKTKEYRKKMLIASSFSSALVSVSTYPRINSFITLGGLPKPTFPAMAGRFFTTVTTWINNPESASS